MLDLLLIVEAQSSVTGMLCDTLRVYAVNAGSNRPAIVQALHLRNPPHAASHIPATLAAFSVCSTLTKVQVVQPSNNTLHSRHHMPCALGMHGAAQATLLCRGDYQGDMPQEVVLLVAGCIPSAELVGHDCVTPSSHMRGVGRRWQRNTELCRRERAGAFLLALNLLGRFDHRAAMTDSI